VGEVAELIEEERTIPQSAFKTPRQSLAEAQTDSANDEDEDEENEDILGASPRCAMFRTMP